MSDGFNIRDSGAGLLENMSNVSNFFGTISTLSEATREPGGTRKIGDKIIDNNTGLSNYVEAILRDIADHPERGDAHHNAQHQAIHNEVIDGLNSDDPELREEAQAIKDALEDAGLWDNDYEDDYDGNSDGGGDGNRDPGGGAETPPAGGFEDPDDTPLVIDLDGDGVELVALENSTANFDLNADGFAERTGWAASDDGFLAFDVNGNGKIDDNTELFGNATGFDNGFLALAQLDSNGDGVIDAADADFASLLVWRDLDQDGVSDDGELLSLSETGIASIDLGSVSVNETNEGHAVTDRSTVTLTDGSTRVIEDIEFERDLSSSYALLPDGFQFDDLAVFIPVLFGSGTIASTWVALSLDTDLRDEAVDLLRALSTGDIESFFQGFEGFVLGWAGVRDNLTDSRGEFIDARHLEFLENIYGAGFEQHGGPNPRVVAGAELEAIFDSLVEDLAGRFLAQSVSSMYVLEDVFSVDGITAAGNPFGFLSPLRDGYSPENNGLSGDIAPVVAEMIGLIADGILSEVDAIRALFLVQNDVNPDAQQFSSDVVTAAVAAGAAPNSDLVFAMEHFEDYQLRVADSSGSTEGSDGFSTFFFGGAGNDTFNGSHAGNIFLGGDGDDIMTGGDSEDTYLYSFGDGNDTITDWDNNERTDVLTFSDLNVGDVSFAADSGDNLVITMFNGETITVIDHFREGGDYSIETIAFADGSMLDLQNIRDKSVADQKASGSVIGSDYIENYTHALGDGSYTIFDWDNNARPDALTFSDLNAGDVSFAADSGDNLVITMSNGETITVIDHFREGEDYSIETIAFADGSMLDLQNIRDKSVADQKASGSVIGSDYIENYTHALGDGSYSIFDWDNNARTDVLTFSGLNAGDVSFASNSGEDLVITMSNGEAITVIDHFRENADYSMETIAFADGTVLNLQDIRDKSVADQKASGSVIGSDFIENYTHALGDGSYSITDWDNNGRADVFVFEDVNSDQVLIQRLASDSNDVVMTLSDGAQVTLLDELHSSNDYGIETIVFADGVELTRTELFDAPIVDDVLVFV